MREAAFLQQNVDRWKQFEELLAKQRRANPDQLADLFVQLTDDLSYARTNYPKSKTTQYLNSLASKVHQAIYRNRKERGNVLVRFWKFDLPMTMFNARRELIYSFVIFVLAMVVGAFSAANDSRFVRLIMGDTYVNETLERIDRGDPMGIYGEEGQVWMFTRITFNNIRVSMMAYLMGFLLSFGTAYILFSNGVMLGAFQYFFHQKGLLLQSALSVWLHGTLEISAIVIAGAAGFTLGNSILFPKTHSRRESFKRGTVEGAKVIVGLIPVFIAAGFIESFLTRYTGMPSALSLTIIVCSLTFIIGYFIIYPTYLNRRILDGTGTAT
jgi:uncharacterized membrane protein SpoIIM required for sporulation